MGCGQSKIHLYPRKSKSKSNGKKSGRIDVDSEADDEDAHVTNDGKEKDIKKDKDRTDEETLSDGKESPEPPNGDIHSLLRAKNLSLLQSQEISSSQQNFFRMLDQKIESGPDYDSSSETEMALEEARLNALVHHWESSSLTVSLCSSTSRSLQGTPVHQIPLRQQPHRGVLQQSLNLDMSHVQQQLKPMNMMSPKRDSGRANLQLSSQAMLPYSMSSSHGGNLIGPCLPNSSILIQQQQANSLNSGNINMMLSGVNSIQSGQIRQPQRVLTPHLAYYTQPQPPQSYFGEVLHPMQVPPTNSEPRFPPAISVQRLAPQVQRQLRETQELIKDTCPQLYATGYGSPGPPTRQQRPSARNRTTLETQYSQELS